MTLEELIAAETQQFSEHLEDILSKYDATHLISIGTGDILSDINWLHETGLKELMIAYAQQKCKEQREICAQEAEVCIETTEETSHQKESIQGVIVYEKGIVNAPLPKFD